MEDSRTSTFFKSVATPPWVAHKTRFPFIRDGVKRGFDILVSLVGLGLVWPVFLVIGMMIRRDSRGPAFYRGKRSGKGGKVFKIVKFRTMYEQPESYEGPGVTAEDDPRVTRLGGWLRATKMNELPQLWNVLKGEMSLVGPRPEDAEITEAWPEDIAREVLSVRPGVTSPASVLYRNEENMLKSREVMSTYFESVLPSKLRLDQLYVRHRTFLLDLDILFWTFLVLLPRVGSYSPGEERLFLGPFSRLIQRHVSWFVVDTLLTFVCIGLVGAFYRSFGAFDVGKLKSAMVALGFALLFSVMNAAMGVNRISWSRARGMDVLDLVPALGVATMAALLANQFLGGRVLFPVGMILISAALSFLGFVMVRYRSRLFSGIASRWLTLRGKAWAAQERVLIVGGGDTGQFVAWLLHNGGSADAFHVIGFVDDDLYKQGIRIGGVNVLGRRSDIPRLVAENDVGLLIFAIHNISPRERAHVLEICASTPARLIMIPDILGALNRVTPAATAGEKVAVFKIESLSSLGSLGGIPSDQVGSWIGELEQKVQAGDLAGVRSFIQSMRDQLTIEQQAPVMPAD